MAYFLVKHGGEVYANTELYYVAVAGGERKFMKMLFEGKATGKELFDQVLYRVNEEQRRLCAAYAPKEQDLDADLAGIGKAARDGEYRVITIAKAFAPKTIKHGGFWFIKIRDFSQPDKYRLLPKLATARVCNCSYVALDAANAAVDKPIVVTIGA
jgi:hypothetical protein